MPAVKTLALVVLVFGGVGSVGRAASTTRWSSQTYYGSPANVGQAVTAVTPLGSAFVYDARLEMGDGPFPDAGSLTVGGEAPWYESREVQKLNGGPITADQRTAFSRTILNRVQQAYSRAGIPVSLTTDSTAPASHVFSILANTSNEKYPQAVGMTTVGGNGVGFINKIAALARNFDELTTAVANNAAHELMHAFGVCIHHDKTGKFLDSGVTSWQTMTDPNATFSKAARDDLLSRDFSDAAHSYEVSGQEIDTAAVPEPSALALWGLAAAAFALRLRSRTARNRA